MIQFLPCDNILMAFIHFLEAIDCFFYRRIHFKNEISHIFQQICIIAVRNTIIDAFHFMLFIPSEHQYSASIQIYHLYIYGNSLAFFNLLNCNFKEVECICDFVSDFQKPPNLLCRNIGSNILYQAHAFARPSDCLKQALIFFCNMRELFCIDFTLLCTDLGIFHLHIPPCIGRKFGQILFHIRVDCENTVVVV